MLLFFGLAAPVCPQPRVALLSSETAPEINLKILNAAWERVQTKYFDPKFGGSDWLKVRAVYQQRARSARDKQELLFVIGQMLDELGTSHVRVWRTVSERSIEKRITGDFDPKVDILYLSYGFDLRKIGQQMVVTRVADSLSSASLLRPGWTLIGIDDGKSLVNWDPSDIAEGRSRDFWFANGATPPIKVSLTAHWLVVKPIRESRVLDDGIRYIRFTGFSDKTSKWLQRELDLSPSDARVIVDLRGNRGGFVQEVRRTLSIFFETDRELGLFVERSGKSKEPKIDGKKEGAFRGKLIVLVDEETASGGEIFAQIIQENDRGLVVGTKSAGMVLNSEEYGLPEDFRISVAVRDYVSPKGKRLEGNGVRPDVEIAPTAEDVSASRDAVLAKALTLFK